MTDPNFVQQFYLRNGTTPRHVTLRKGTIKLEEKIENTKRLKEGIWKGRRAEKEGTQTARKYPFP